MSISEKRQLKAARLVARGKSKAEVARQLNMSPRSVGRYFDKYGARFVHQKTPDDVSAVTVEKDGISSNESIERDAEYSFSVTPSSVTIIQTKDGGEIRTVNVARTQATYADARNACSASMQVDGTTAQQILEDAFQNFDVTSKIKSISLGNVTVDPFADKVSFVGESGREYNFEGAMVERLVAKVRAGENVDSLVRFADKLSRNPSHDIVSSVYEFLEACDIQIDDNGDVICYKRVTSDFKDVRTRTFDNSVGAIVVEDRNQVETDQNMTCAKGLHVCSLSYLPHYGGEVIIRVKVSPEDIVAIPTDYYSYDNTTNSHRAKMRCCKYEVLSVVNTIEQERNRK